jgi:IS30 family transposase
MTDRPRRSNWQWTRGEDEKLRELELDKVSSREIARQLNRTIDSIRSRAKRLNIALRRRRPGAQ